MSEVKRFDHVNHAHVDDCAHIENPGGAWVKASDYDALAAEAQALREEVAALRAKLAMAEDAAQVIYRGRGTEERGTITSAKGAHLMIKLDGESKPRKFHPTWELQYLPEQA
ncbi:hypothetical protein AVM47_015635 [Pseudomonas aeruginosa]|uniref:hypothetical protein n=1 Tax=Pseudomonas aeruginosa TaxID=287 RepID=UPI001908FA5B|nr:hypothetical protein [Pseudomonas aeruginosa]MBK1799327.1 hypothetical protein [Pseudomonas aeruginosa]